MRFGLIGRTDDPKALEVIKQIMVQLKSQGHDIFIDKHVADILGLKGVEMGKEKVDIMVVVGGDGTLLRVAHMMVDRGVNVPLLGVKYGHVGFLCELRPEEFWQYIPRLGARGYNLERRRLLKASWPNAEAYAINEVLTVPVEVGRTVHIDVATKDELVYSGRCDGVIVATSLGSTAYIASRGGPIVDPRLDVMIIDVLNPLLWGQRVIVMPFDDNEVIIRASKNMAVVIDGEIKGYVSPGMELQVGPSNKTISFVRFEWRFYERVRKRTTTEI